MKRWTAVLLCVLAVLAAAGVGYAVGCRVTRTEPEKPEDSGVDVLDTQTFYAEITEIDDSRGYLLVSGLAVNDGNWRGDFYFTAEDDTQFLWRGTEITCADLDVGDLVAVTMTGEVLETDPAGIPTVLRVQLLDDEK